MVQSASGKNVVLTDGTTHRRDKVLRVPHNTVIAPTIEKNVIMVATKQHKDKQLYKRENIKETDIIQGGCGAWAGRCQVKMDRYLEKNN